MPKPLTVRELVVLIRRSRLLDGPRLDRFLRRSPPPAGPADLLQRLVEDGALTRFQAGHLAAGRWRGLALGAYRVLDRIGGGGMAQVYKAEHTTLGREVAIKVLDPRLTADPVARERFVREARAAAALDHPNIVRVIDADPAADPPYMVLEYIDGITLQAAVARAGTFAAGTAAFCGKQVALALARAAAVGLVHRDIKPANLVVDRSGTVKVLDLGIVRLERADPGTGPVTRRLVLGTADYLAPEQAVDSHAVDIRADLYALGGTVYFLLAGHPPFPDGTAAEKIVRKQSHDPPRIDHLRPDLPPGLADVVHTLMARDPQDRYPTPAAAAAALKPFVGPEDGFPERLFVPTGNTALRLALVPTPPDPLPADPTGSAAVPCLAALLAERGEPDPAPTDATEVRAVRYRGRAVWLAVGVSLTLLAAASVCWAGAVRLP